MIYPVGFRRNNRYRGPIESLKQSMNNHEVQLNIENLHNAFNNIEKSAFDIKVAIFNNDRTQIKSKKRKLNDNISNIMEVMEYGNNK